MDAAAKLIGEAKNGGADYVQTPEMTNIMELSREKLFATIVPEENDTTLATFRELARALGIYVHVGSLAVKASRRQGGQPLVPDRPARRDRRALRQDPHVRRRPQRRRELSRVAQLPAGRSRGRDRPAVGPARPDHLLRPALSGALSRARRSRRDVPGDPLGVHAADRRGALARADARARDRERLVRVRGRAGRRPRERPRDVRPFARGRSVGPRHRRRRHRAGRRVRRHRSGRSVAPRAGAFPRCSMAGVSRSSSRWRSRRISTWSEATRDPLHSRLRQAPRVRELVPEFRRLRQAGQARPRLMPALRLRQGREGHHGAAPRPQGQEHADRGAGRRGRARVPPRRRRRSR